MPIGLYPNNNLMSYHVVAASDHIISFKLMSDCYWCTMQIDNKQSVWPLLSATNYSESRKNTLAYCFVKTDTRIYIFIYYIYV